jgi:hypothetical protein
MNPVEAFLEEYATEKEAGFGDTLKSTGGRFGDALALGGATALSTAAIGGAALGISALHSAATKTRDFRGMMDMNLDLHQFHQQDPKMFNQMYTSLRRANQSYAADPIIAGTYMRKMMDSPMSAGGFLTDAMNSVPSSQGQFMNDVGKSGREAAAGHMKSDFSGPGTADQLANLKNQRALEHMRAAKSPNDPGWFGPSGGKKNRP